MRTPTRREGFLGVALACLGVALLLWVPGHDPEDSSAGVTDESRVRVPSPLTIGGDVGDEVDNADNPLAPGVMAPLDLSLENPTDHDVVVGRITVTVTDVDAPQADADHACSVADFNVRPLADGISFTLEAHEADDLSGLGVAPRDLPAIGMLNRPVNQDGCKGALLTLGYEVSAMEVQR